MTYALYGEIHFPAHRGREAFYITRFSEVKIESSWKSLTDTAEIVLPRNVRDFDRDGISEVFKEGDPVRILLGYNGSLTEEFSGYISGVPAGIPLVISCEDEMYQLKRKSASVSIKDCTLKTLLQTIAPGYAIQCDEIRLGTIRYDKRAVSSILDDLRKQGVNTWFEGKTLHAFSVSKSDISPVTVVLEQTAGESLKQKAVEDVLVVIKLIRKIGKKLKQEYGDKDAGKRIVRELSGITMSEAEMLSEAKRIYAQSKRPGLDGDVTLFGVPRIRHGYRINFDSVYYPEKKGKYYVDAVTKSFGKEGYRQVCKLGEKEI
jgi:hypothetical protein